MQLHFTYAFEDYLSAGRLRRPSWLERSRPREERFLRRLGFVQPFVPLVALAVYLWAHPHWDLRVLGWMVAAGIFTGFATWAVVTQELARHRLRRETSRLKPVMMELAPRGIWQSWYGGPVKFEPWDRFDRVIEEDDRLFLHRIGTRHDWLILPLRGLDSSDQLPGLRSILERHVRPPTGGFPVVAPA